MSTEIRPCTSCDAPYFRQILMEPRTEPFFPTGDQKEIDDAAERWIKMAVEQNCGLTLVYCGSPVAVGIFFPQTYLRIRHQAVHVLAVSADYRRLGLGTKLLRALEELARDKHQIELSYVEIYDDPGVETFYRKQGYREFARQRGWSKDATKNPVQYRARVCMEKFI